MTTDEEDAAILDTLGLCSALLAMVGAAEAHQEHVETLKRRVKARQEVRRVAARLGIPSTFGRRPETWRQN